MMLFPREVVHAVETSKNKHGKLHWVDMMKKVKKTCTSGTLNARRCPKKSLPGLPSVFPPLHTQPRKHLNKV